MVTELRCVDRASGRLQLLSEMGGTGGARLLRPPQKAAGKTQGQGTVTNPQWPGLVVPVPLMLTDGFSKSSPPCLC